MTTMITADMVKALRERTGAGVLDCKRALEEAGGDFDEAVELLRMKGLASAARKVGREAREGLVEAYIHTGGRIGAMVELNCETDFVARTGEFKALARDLAMQVAAIEPLYVSEDQLPEDTLARWREQIRQEIGASDDEEAVEQRLQQRLDEVCLLRQPFIRDGSVTVGDLITRSIAQLGENIVVRRFARFVLGE